MMKPENRSIAFIIGSLVLGGAEKQLYLLVQKLQERGWKVIVITLHPGFNDHWEQPLRKLGIPVYGVSIDSSRARRFLIIRDILRQSQSQIVHSWSLYTNFYAAVASQITSVKVRLGSERASQIYSLGALGRWKYELSLLGLDGIVTNSQSASISMHRHKSGIKVWVVPNGLVMPVNLLTKLECRAHLNIFPSALVVGAVGSLEPIKNYKDLITAMGILVSRGLQVSLILIGDGSLRNELQNQAKQSLIQNNLIFAGAIPDAAQWMPAFDVFCMPSSDEGMPNVLMEASAAGLPVVATKVGAVSDIVEDGITGLLTAVNDVLALANALEKLLGDPDLRRQFGKAGQEKMKCQYGVEQMVDSMIEIYSGLLENH